MDAVDLGLNSGFEEGSLPHASSRDDDDQFEKREPALDCGFRLDLLVDNDVIVEVKSVGHLAPIHTAQVLTYLRLTGARRALLLNFNALTLKAGLRSFLPGGTPVPTEGEDGSEPTR